uniref:Uncharacterized protein n=1 Tax=Anguilla anguilla TaxID=7936 RepID=A0A0E9X1F3_ANGAN
MFYTAPIYSLYTSNMHTATGEHGCGRGHPQPRPQYQHPMAMTLTNQKKHTHTHTQVQLQFINVSLQVKMAINACERMGVSRLCESVCSVYPIA